MWVLYLDLLCDSELFMLNIVHFDHQNVGGGQRLELWTQVCFRNLKNKIVEILTMNMKMYINCNYMCYQP